MADMTQTIGVDDRAFQRGMSRVEQRGKRSASMVDDAWGRAGKGNKNFVDQTVQRTNKLMSIGRLATKVIGGTLAVGAVRATIGEYAQYSDEAAASVVRLSNAFADLRYNIGKVAHDAGLVDGLTEIVNILNFTMEGGVEDFVADLIAGAPIGTTYARNERAGEARRAREARQARRVDTELSFIDAVIQDLSGNELEAERQRALAELQRTNDEIDARLRAGDINEAQANELRGRADMIQGLTTRRAEEAAAKRASEGSYSVREAGVGSGMTLRQMAGSDVKSEFATLKEISGSSKVGNRLLQKIEDHLRRGMVGVAG